MAMAMPSSRSELSLKEKALFKYTQERNYEEVKRLITEEENIYVDCVDAEGMTPLQHAAYKGCTKLCKLLLDCGADVNYTRQVSRYTALTFACVAGKADVVRLLLEYGASTSNVTSINKTSAQMAAFVGNHHIVSIINNFIPIQEIEYFNRIQGLETEPRLPPTMNTIVHKMAIMTNINPVRLIMYVQSNPVLLHSVRKVVRVFNAMAEKYLRVENNDLLSLKFHHLAYVLSACEKYYIEHASAEESERKSIRECLNPFIKYLIKGDVNGFPVNLEKFLRQDIQRYPFVECHLFLQLVRTLSPVEIGGEPSAISIIGEAVNGQRMSDNTCICSTCWEPNAEKKCSVCKSVQYCDKACQKMHWFTHKLICPHLTKLNEGVEKLHLESNFYEKDPNAPGQPGCSSRS
ncbi:ankyrin repeat and MYND domain-containing protein 2-like [Argiope bruennichi]|uniref:ankyrin repeat and MYND domain-containing protein 2-like n=1 Tax=Argiope bruennichi TaxID=94029 RepID=UPI0024953E68|nr:ankyrin repeat and MYND domain-containing protein 2-like [Argiope bruennichi]